MVSKSLIALVTIVNTGLIYLISITGLGVSVCIRFAVTEHSLKVMGRGGTVKDGLFMVCSPR